MAICATLTSCVKKSDYDALQAEKDALAQSLAESQDRIKSLEEANEALTADKDALTADLDQVKEAIKYDIDITIYAIQSTSRPECKSI